MAGRNYEAPQFGARDTRSVQRGQVAGADTRAAVPISVGDDQWQDRMLRSLGQQGTDVLNKMADVEFQNLYLEGQAQVGVAESEAEIQGNPLTRDWKIAGYRDTMGKLALADLEAQFQQDLPLLREKDASEVQAYLAERRAKVMPALASMSREARASASGQILLQDRASTKKWATEHTKFIIEKKSQAVHTQWNTTNQTLKSASLQAALGDLKPEDFSEQLRSAAGVIVGSVWMDSSLPSGVQRELTFGMLQNSMAEDNVALYEYLQANPIPDGSGGQSTLLSRLDGDQQLKLANAYREAMNRTSDARNLYRMEQVANLDAQLDANTYQGTYEGLKGLLDPMVLNKSITGEKRQGLLNKYLDKQYKREQNVAFADMTIRGDVNGLYAAGKDIEDGIKAVEQTLGSRNVSPEQRLSTWMNIGKNGVDKGFKKAGEMLGVTMGQILLSPDGTVLPQHARVFAAVNQEIRAAEAAGLGNTRVAVLSGLPEDQRMQVEQIMRRVDAGAGLDKALQDTKAIAARDDGLSPALKAARAQSSATEVTKAIAAIEPRGLLETLWDHTKAAFGSKNAASDLAISPTSYMGSRDGWFSDSPTVQYYTEQMREAVRQEANNVLLLRPSATPDEVMSVAKANVAARTISTQNGPIAMPRNVNLQTVFGVGPGNQSAIGKAIDGMLPSTVENSRWQLTFAQGRLLAQEVDNKGVNVGQAKYIAPEQVRTRIAEDIRKETAVADRMFGDGRVVEADNLRIQFNGQNTAGVPISWMYGYRENLVAHEGVREKVYKDLSGNKDSKGNDIMTVGVGLSSTNTFYPKPDAEGKITSEQATQSFLNASNEAAQAGISVAKNLGLNNQFTFQLMAELAYQSGTPFMSRQDNTGKRYREFAAALQGKDVEAAKDAFKRTAAWYYSRGESDKPTKRQQNYLRLIENSMK